MNREYYDWENQFTTDLDLCWKTPDAVLCNGMVYERVVRCLSGENGFVEYYPVDASGRVLVHHDRPVSKLIMGTVQVEKK